MGMGKYGLVSILGFSAFFAYLGESYKGPEKPKFLLDRDFVEGVKKYQPALNLDHYDKAKN